MTDPALPRCPGCGGVINDDDTIQRTVAGQPWHARCKDMYDTKRQREAGPLMSTATLHERLMETKPLLFECTDDPRPISFPPPTIHYNITPKRFLLDIPVEALANMTPDAHTRILAMLNAWINENKPPVLKGPTP